MSLVIRHSQERRVDASQRPTKRQRIDSDPPKLSEAAKKAQQIGAAFDQYAADIKKKGNTKKNITSLGNFLTHNFIDFRSFISSQPPISTIERELLGKQFDGLRGTVASKEVVPFRAKGGKLFTPPLEHLFRPYEVNNKIVLNIASHLPLAEIFPFLKIFFKGNCYSILERMIAEGRIKLPDSKEAIRQLAFSIPPEDLAPFAKQFFPLKWSWVVAKIVSARHIPLSELNMSLTNLKLITPHLSYVNIRGLKAKDALKVLENCSRMEFLALSFMNKATCQLLDQAKKASPGLRFVDMYQECPSSTTEGIQEFLHSFPSRNIAQLRMDCKHLVLKDIMRVAPYLTHLDIYCGTMKPKDILALLKCCKELRYLTLDSPNFSSFGDSLVSSHLHKLELCNNDNLETLPDNLPVTDLILRGFLKLGKFPANMPRLKKMTLEACAVEVIPLYPQLTKLECIDCRSLHTIHSQPKEIVTRNCPRYKRISEKAPLAVPITRKTHGEIGA